MFFKSKITRMAAFLMSCLIVGACMAQCVYIYDNLEGPSSQKYDFAELKTKTTDESTVLYRKLWMLGTMYLRNLDENGVFQGTSEMEEQTRRFLRSEGLMDSSGRITLNVPEGYKYYVSWGSDKAADRYSIANMSRFPDVATTKNLLYSYKGDIHGNFPMDWRHGSTDFNWFETNYGMTYYYLVGRGVAFFDFDTTGLNYYTDELGANIYYKTDGTTPVPESRYISDKLNYEEAIYAPDITQDDADYPDEPEDRYDEPDEPDDQPEDTTADGERTEDTTDAANTTPVPETTAKPDPVSAFFADRTRYANDEGIFYYYDADLDALVPFSSDRFIKTQGEEYSLNIAVCPPEETVDELFKAMELEENVRRELMGCLLKLIPLGALAFLLMVYFLGFGGYSTKEKKFVLSMADRIFVEIPIAVIFGVLCGALLLMDDEVINDIGTVLKELYGANIIAPVYGILFMLIYAVIVLMLNTIFVRLKCRSFWKTTFIGYVAGLAVKGVKKLREHIFDSTIEREMMRDDKMTRRFMVRTVIYLVIETIVLCISADYRRLEVFFTISIVATAAYIIGCLRDQRDIIKLYRHITDINNGSYTRKTADKSSVIYVPTEKLNSISDSIQHTVEEQVKSERMKIELVTNVSHDLKTPLTSIISYIDLLKAEDLPPAAQDYVTIIDGKSQRLKTMVADLFDLAKATSKTDINSEELDAVILTEQVLADLTDKIAASGREIRKDIRAEQAPVCADGKKMYRVFQNLIDNALKYSMEGTRIYLTLKNENGSCVVTVKNIASYEMDFDASEIMERFTRGDRSRSTEGNGLGLSIAKSFTEACGGGFSVTIDGDVFIAELTLPLISSELGIRS